MSENCLFTFEITYTKYIRAVLVCKKNNKPVKVNCLQLLPLLYGSKILYSDL